MYAVVATVDINDGEVAMNTLAEQVIPMVKQAPGFVGGYWVRLDAGHGTSVVVFETEERRTPEPPRLAAGRPASRLPA